MHIYMLYGDVQMSAILIPVLFLQEFTSGEIMILF
jgi:hypothetical protein